MKLDVDGYIYKMNCYGYAKDSMYGGLINIETPTDELKKLFFEAKYSVQESHKAEVSLKKNNETLLDISGFLKVTVNEGNVNIDIKSSCEEISHINFNGMYDINGPQKHVSGDMKINNSSPIKFTAIWSYNSPVFIKITLDTPWVNPNFTLTIESDLEKENKHTQVKYETGVEFYELKFSRTVSGSESSNSVVVSSPLKGYENTSFKWTLGKESFDATADFAEKRIKFTLDYSCKDDTYSLNATLVTPFSSWETIKLRTYCKIANGFLVTGSFIRENEKIELIIESNANRLLLKINSPYRPFKNFTIDIKVESENGYELIGISTLENTKTELHLLLKDSAIKIDFDSPYEPFKDLHLEGSMEHNNNEYSIEGYGKWEDQKVRISGLWLMYEEFGAKTSLEIETPFPGYDKSAIYVDIKKPLTHEGFDIKLVANVPGYETQSIMLSLKHEGLLNADMELIAGDFKSTLTYNIIHNTQLGETTVTVKGSLPLKNLSKFSFEGKLIAPSNDNISIQLELHTPAGVNQVRGNFQVKSDAVATEVKLELPLFLGLSPVSFSFNLQKKSNTDINLTGILLLPEKIYEAHTSFLLEDTSLNVLFKETGFYDVTIELHSYFTEGVSFDISAQFPSEKHILQASFTNTATGFEVRNSVTSPLLDHSADFKIFTTYLKDKLGFAASANIGGQSYKLRTDFGILDSEYAGEMEIEVNGITKVYIKCDYAPMTGDLVINLPNSDHEFTFLIKSEDQKTTLNFFGKSPYIPGDIAEIVFILQSDDTSKQASLKIMFENSTHNFVITQTSTKVELEINTPLLDFDKLKLVSVGKTEADNATGEVSLMLGNVHHYFKASLNKNLNSDIRVKTPWLSQNEIHVMTKYDNLDGEYIAAEISYKNGESMFDLKQVYDFSDHTFCKASVTFSSSVKGYESIILSGHYKHADTNEVELKLEADDRFIPTFSINAKYVITPSLLNVELNLKSSFTEMQDLGFFIAISPTNKEKQNIVVTGPKMKLEISLDSHFYDDKFDVSLTTKWNDEHIVGTVSAKYENPLNLEIHIETPFEGYEHLKYNGKLFWKYEETESDYRRYVTGLEWNEKIIEVNFGFIPGEMASFDFITPFKSYESLSLKVEKTMLSNEKYFTASIKSNFYIFLNWNIAFTITDSRSANKEHNNTYSASLKFDDTHGYYSFLLKHSSTIDIEANKISGRYEISGFGIHEIFFINVSRNDKEVKLYLIDKSGEILKLTVTIDTHQHIYGCSFNLREFHGLFNKHSGQFYIAPSLSEDTEEWGVSLKFDNHDIFTVKIVLEERKKSLILVNPFYPVSLHYTYDSSPNTFEVHGELCWNLNDRLQNTAGGKLYLTTNDVKHLEANIVLPGHHYILEGTYSDKVPGMIKHTLKVEIQGTTFGYKLEIQQVEIEHGYKNIILCKVDTPEYPIELSGHLYTEGLHKVKAYAVLDLIEKSELFVSYHSDVPFNGEVEVFVKSSSLSFHVRAFVDICTSCETSLIEIEHDGSTLLKLKVNNVGDNVHDVVLLEANSDWHSFPFSVSGEVGQSQETYHFTLKYNIFDCHCYSGEYFGELTHDYRKLKFGKANRFLIEGNVESLEDGHKLEVHAEEEEHEYHGTVLVDGNPIFVKMDTKADNQRLLTAQFDATDMLSTKVFIQPSLFFDVQDMISYYI